jgi:carbon storage regulator
VDESDDLARAYVATNLGMQLTRLRQNSLAQTLHCDRRGVSTALRRDSQMLVISRRRHEELIIDNRIRVEVIAIQGNRVRLGITAPPEVPVSRGELQTHCDVHADSYSPWQEVECVLS